MPLLTDLARQLLQSATRVAVTRMATHTVRLSGPALVGWAYVPGQTLNVFFGLPPTRLRRACASVPILSGATMEWQGA